MVYFNTRNIAAVSLLGVNPQFLTQVLGGVALSTALYAFSGAVGGILGIPSIRGLEVRQILLQTYESFWEELK